MQADRHDRVESLLIEMVASFIQGEANPDPLITVTKVTTSPDYKNATVYITTIPSGREDDALIFLQRMGKEMRRYIMKKSDLKIVPHLKFEVDHGERHRQHIDDIANNM